MSRKDRQRGFTDENVAVIVESARRFVRCADEFLPDHREAVGEYLSELIEDVDHLDDSPSVGFFEVDHFRSGQPRVELGCNSSDIKPPVGRSAGGGTIHVG